MPNCSRTVVKLHVTGPYEEKALVCHGQLLPPKKQEANWLVKKRCLAVKQRVLQIGPLGGTLNGLLSGNHVALIMAGMERMMTCPREYLNELASSGFFNCTTVPN